MLHMERVRDIGADEATIDDARVAVAREVLRGEIRVTKGRTGTRKRRLGIGLGAGALVATGLATAVVAVNIVGPPPEQISPADYAAAAEVLEDASTAILNTSDPVLENGQYLRIEETTVYLHTTAGGLPDRPETAAFTQRDTDVWYIPADRSHDWILDESAGRETIAVYGDGGEEFRDSVLAEDDGSSTEIRSFPGGMQGASPEARPLERFRDIYDEMPREPGALIDWLMDYMKRTDPHIADDDVEPSFVAKLITEALWLDLPPAEVRAALLKALAELDAYTLREQDDATATFERRGAEGETDTFTVSTETGSILSVTNGRLPGATLVPEIPALEIRFSHSIVDSAPAPTV